MARKSLSKKLRFEVFKRDSFQCQYCGKSAPDVVLEVDHIHPVAKGGLDELTNLITCCFNCNRGKSDKSLDDNSVVVKQKKQLDELNERRQQLEMMMDWRKELLNLESDKAQAVADEFKEYTGCSITAEGMKNIYKWLKKYDLELLFSALGKSVSQYDDDFEKAFSMIPRIAYYLANPDSDMKELYYIRGIARNRCNYFDDRRALSLLKEALNKGNTLADLKAVSSEINCWTGFREELERMIGGSENGEH